jgi:hypothetical protein
MRRILLLWSLIFFFFAPIGKNLWDESVHLRFWKVTILIGIKKVKKTIEMITVVKILLWCPSSFGEFIKKPQRFFMIKATNFSELIQLSLTISLILKFFPKILKSAFNTEFISCGFFTSLFKRICNLCLIFLQKIL